MLLEGDAGIGKTVVWEQGVAAAQAASPAMADLSPAGSTRCEEVCNMWCSWFEVGRDSLERAPGNLNWGDPSNLGEWAEARRSPAGSAPCCQTRRAGAPAHW
jgi:hypothetical protein